MFSEVAERYEIDMTPPAHIVPNIEKQVKKILQPLRTALGSTIILSGYRPKQLNQLVGGSQSGFNKTTHLLGVTLLWTD